MVQTTEQVAETSGTRPETRSTFLGNLFFCVIFPFVALWYTPKYAMRAEYGRAAACAAVAVSAVVLALLLL